MIVRFDDIVGQDEAIELLRSAVAADRLAHGLIFAGPAGVGKATTAAALAGMLLCKRPGKAGACGSCESCRLLDSGNHPDFHRITRDLIRYHDKTGKSKGIDLSVNVLRPELMDPASRTAALGGAKVFVIEEAHTMNLPAQNAILKTLEEPAGRTAIILLTDQSDALLPTIRSRCQMVRFRALPDQWVREQLAARKIEPETARVAADFSEGSLGAALSLIESGAVARAGWLSQRLTEMAGPAAGAARLSGITELADWFKSAADDFAKKQLERDELASKDAATRQGLDLYLRLASKSLRSTLARLAQSGDAAAMEQICRAIESIAQAQTYLDANVNVAVVLQQLSGDLSTELAGA